MTRPARTPPLAFSGLDEVAAVLRRNGGRLSSARRVVLEALWGADGPVSAERLARGLDEAGVPIDVTSVYRNLEHLEELGVVRHVHMGHGPGLYALVRGGEKEFLACERCDRVTSVDPAALAGIRALIEQEFGYRARFTHFPIMGLCAACAGEEDAESALGRGSHEHHHGDVIHSHPGHPH